MYKNFKIHVVISSMRESQDISREERSVLEVTSEVEMKIAYVVLLEYPVHTFSRRC